MILTISECFDKGIENFRDRLFTAPSLPRNFILWFDNEKHHAIPDFLRSKMPSEWLELAGEAAMATELLKWFDGLSRSQQLREATEDCLALVEDNGHV